MIWVLKWILYVSGYHVQLLLPRGTISVLRACGDPALLLRLWPARVKDRAERCLPNSVPWGTQ